MKIQLDNWRVIDLDLKSVQEEDSKNENSFDLKTGHFFPENEPKEFGVGFEIEIKDIEFNLSIESVFIFKVDEEITEEFKVSDFPKINAPAIAFPFLRAYISNITLQSGYKPVMLPSINFVSLAEEE